jgi:hypothetical protein
MPGPTTHDYVRQQNCLSIPVPNRGGATPPLHPPQAHLPPAHLLPQLIKLQMLIFENALEGFSVLPSPQLLCSTCLLLLLLLLLQIRTQPHLGCCLAAATAAASAIFMHLCTNSATPYTSRQHIRSCNDVNGNCANRRSRLTTAVA